MALAADEPDDSVEEAGDGSRLCAVTRKVLPRERLIRFVAGPGGEVVPDIKGKLPGRGVWVAGASATVAAAVKSGAFGRGLKRPVRVEPALAEIVGQLLERSALDRLSIANKAGEVILGFERIASSIASGEPFICLVHASDGAPGGSEKLDRRFAAASGEKSPLPILIFESARLSLALGRPNVIHAALKPGGASRKFVEDVLRLTRYRTDGGD
jgi:hypothetical protein